MLDSLVASSLLMYIHDLDGPSNRSPTIVIHDAPLPLHMEEVHSSPIMDKVTFELLFVIQEEDHPLSYNIEEILGTFTFNLQRKEVG